MNKTDAILKKGNKLFEDNQYILLWTKFFGISLVTFTSYYVFVKAKSHLLKLNGREKIYLMSVTYSLTKKHGVSARSVIDHTYLFKDLSEAIANRNNEIYQKFFKASTQDKAKKYAEQASCHDVKKFRK